MKFGVIGAGEIGGLRVASLRDHPDTDVVAVADVSQAQAEHVAKGVGARAVTEWRELLDAPEIDAIVISTPLPLHEEMAAAALEAGKHVLIEKPLANTLEGCRRLVDLARSTGKTLGVGFNHRFYPSVKFLTQVVEDGTLGELDHIRAYGGHDGLPSLKEEWMYEYPAAGGGAMWDVGIHMTDLVRYLAGELTEVYGVATNRVWDLGESEDNAMAIFKGERKLPVIYQASWSEWAGYHWYVDVYGTKGMCRAYYAPMYNLLVTQSRPGGGRKKQRKFYPELILREKFKGWQSTTQTTFDEETVEFLKMVEGEPSRLASGWDGLRASEIALAVHRATETGEPVKLSTPPED
jgi:predicted dehydrogenase